MKTSQPSPSARRFASIAITMHCVPNRSAHRWSVAGSRTAALFIETLSAPARSSSFTSSSVRTPPPTVSGMNTCSAVREITSSVAVAPLDGGGDVEEDQLVGALAVVVPGHLDRIAGVAHVLELRALHDATAVDVEARDQALREHRRQPRMTWASFSVFS